ncbi:MAG: glycosyltransferase family 2 protein [Thiohalocapsa sp.]
MTAPAVPAPVALPVAVSVVIPTYRRPELLRRTLESCLAQQDVAAAFEIVVVDNDAAGSARAVVERVAAAAGVRVRYVPEPRPGISHARNTGVASAAGQYVAFIDDDEAAEPGWLAAMLATIERSGADAVIGPVRPQFPAGQAVDAYRRGVYTRDTGLPTGTQLARWSGIGNTLLDKARCFTAEQPFDPRLGLSGGEDSLFFRQLLRRGGKLVWCAEAAVRESIAADKLSPRYLLRRSFRSAQTLTFVCTAVRPPELRLALFWMAVGSAQVILYAPAALALRALRRKNWLPAADKALGGLGKVFWHPKLHLRLYRSH